MVATYSANLPHKRFKAQQVRENEGKIANIQGIEMFSLMQAAGQAVFDLICAKVVKPDKMTVLCGYGNNGGDGYIVAQLAKVQGWQVRLIQVGDGEKVGGDAAKARALWLSHGGVVEHSDSPLEADTVIVDGLLGTGLNGPVRAEFAALIEQVNHLCHQLVCSIDNPSGLDADTGQILGCAIKADVTCTFVAVKQGLSTGVAGDYCGELYFAGLGIADAFEQQVVPTALCLEPTKLRQLLAPRARSCHKGNNGHVLLIGGNKGMSGAIRMAAKAALRAGAGLVSVLTHIDNETIVALDCAEVMVRGIGSDTDISEALDKVDVIVCGPGLGLNQWAKNLLQQVLASEKAKVLDADALNIVSLATKMTVLTSAVMTPHPKEAARLLKRSVAAVQNNRFNAVTALAETFQSVALLKGAGTLIGDGQQLYINTTGNPGMATAGMGDVLSGIIGGLLAQGLTPIDAAVVGAWVHGVSADNAALAGERGMMASDLYDHIRTLVN